MKEVKSAANLSLDRIHSNLRELDRGLELVSREIQETSTSSSDTQSTQNERFLEIMIPFAEKTKMDMVGLHTYADTSLGKLKDLAAYLGETIKEDKQTELFKTMREFLFMFDCVSTEIKATKERSEKAANTNQRQLGRLDPLHIVNP